MLDSTYKTRFDEEGKFLLQRVCAKQNGTDLQFPLPFLEARDHRWVTSNVSTGDEWSIDYRPYRSKVPEDTSLPPKYGGNHLVVRVVVPKRGQPDSGRVQLLNRRRTTIYYDSHLPLPKLSEGGELIRPGKVIRLREGTQIGVELDGIGTAYWGIASDGLQPLQPGHTTDISIEMKPDGSVWFQDGWGRMENQWYPCNNGKILHCGRDQELQYNEASKCLLSIGKFQPLTFYKLIQYQDIPSLLQGGLLIGPNTGVQFTEVNFPLAIEYHQPSNSYYWGRVLHRSDRPILGRTRTAFVRIREDGNLGYKEIKQPNETIISPGETVLLGNQRFQFDGANLCLIPKQQQ